MYEETSDQRRRRERDRGVSRMASVMLTMAKERHGLALATGSDAHFHDFDACENEVCRDARDAAQEVDA